MGEGQTYRWERRRQKNARRAAERQKAPLWGFELVLIILIFAIWLIGARFLVIYPIVKSPCVEAFASFGSRPRGMPVFDLLFWIIMAMGVYWAVILMAYWRSMKGIKLALFHASLLGCLVLLAANFRMLHVGDIDPPDGTLSVRQSVVDTASGKPEYFERAHTDDKYSRWHLGKPYTFEDVWFVQGSPQCVWLERNLIADSHIDREKVYDGYGAASFEERLEMTKRTGYRRAVRWEHPTFLEQIKILWRASTGAKSGMEILRDRQFYRPLTETERARFLKKQECLADDRFSPKRFDDCRYYWGTDFDAYYRDNPN